MIEHLSNEVINKINSWLIKFPNTRKRSVILIALRFVQEENGGVLSNSLMSEISQYLNLPQMFVYEVASFYSMYDLQNAACFKICICTNVTCSILGSFDLLNHIKKTLKIGLNEVSQDGKFYLKEVECLAACDKAPVIQIGNELYELVSCEKFDNLIAKLK